MAKDRKREKKENRERKKKASLVPSGIREAGTGLWVVRSQVISSRTGRRVERTRRVAGGLEEAVKAKVELDEAIRSGGVEREERERVTVSDYATRWQERKAREGLADSTIKARADILVDHVLPFLGSYDVRRITRGDLLQWRDHALGARRKGGGAYSAVTINGWWRVLKAMLRSAYAELELGLCPADGVRPLREDVSDHDEDRTLVPAEVVSLLQHLRRLRPDVWPLALVGFATGMRHCELSALKWEDVDWERGRIRVRRSHVKGVVQERTKTRGSRRWVGLLPVVVELLREHRCELVRRQGAGLDAGWVFPSAAGTPYSTASVDSALKRAAKAAGIGRVVSTKTFRRTWDTRAVLLQIDRALIQANTGHTTDAMTDRYARFRTEQLAEVQEQVMGFLGEAVEGEQD